MTGLSPERELTFRPKRITPAVSRRRMHIAWTNNSAQYPDSLPRGVSVMYEGDIVYAADVGRGLDVLRDRRSGRSAGLVAVHQRLVDPAEREQLHEPRDPDLDEVDARGLERLHEAVRGLRAIHRGHDQGDDDREHHQQLLPPGAPILPLVFMVVMGLAVLAYLVRGGGSPGNARRGDATPTRRGFLLGATSGRTTLAGEGLQHQDGHSHVLSSTVPNCLSYDPAYAHRFWRVLVQVDRVFQVFRAFREELGTLDRIIVNAGLGKGRPVGTGYFYANRQTAETNFVAALAQCEAAVEIFRE